MENAEVVTNEIIDIADHVMEAEPAPVTEVIAKRNGGAFMAGAIASSVAIAAIYLGYKYVARPLWARHKAKSRKPEMIHTDGKEVETDSSNETPEEDET